MGVLGFVVMLKEEMGMGFEVKYEDGFGCLGWKSGDGVTPSHIANDKALVAIFEFLEFGLKTVGNLKRPRLQIHYIIYLYKIK